MKIEGLKVEIGLLQKQEKALLFIVNNDSTSAENRSAASQDLSKLLKNIVAKGRELSDLEAGR
ncbi:MAG TPA: hypothetical protein VH117_10525 [Edaphobacter sp.]|jgi:hypothetical protein|nr:hypothetical protein [Edaphobacter sp.]